MGDATTSGIAPAPAPIPAWRRLALRVLLYLLAGDLVLVGLYGAGVLAGQGMSRGLFYLVQLDGEANLAAWYAASQLFLIGVAALALASRLFAEDDRVRPLKRLFLAVGIGFMFLSADEAGTIHERVSRSITTHLPQFLELEHRLLSMVGIERELRGGGSWIVLYAVVGAVVLAAFAPLMLRALRSWRVPSLLFAGGFGLVVSGGVFAEALGYFVPIDTLARFLEIGIEESLELVGASVMVYALSRVLFASFEHRLSGAGRISPIVVLPAAGREHVAAEPHEAEDTPVSA